MFKLILQLISVSSLAVAAYLTAKGKRSCFIFYQVGAIARIVQFGRLGLHIELLLQFYFTYMNVKGFRAWAKGGK